MFRILVENIEWDCDGQHPQDDCGLPRRHVFECYRSAELNATWDLPPGERIAAIEVLILAALHDQFGFNPIRCTIAACERNQPVEPNAPTPEQVATYSDIPVNIVSDWGSHPQHAAAVQQALDQLLTPRQRQQALQRSAMQAAPAWVSSPLPSMQVTPIRGARAATPEEIRQFEERLSGRLGGSSGIRSLEEAVRSMGNIAAGVTGGMGGGGALYTDYTPASGVDRFLNDLRSHRLADVVLFFEPLTKLNGNECHCPVCEGSNDKLEYNVTMRGSDNVVNLFCVTCQLMIVPQRTGFALEFGDHTAVIEYQHLGKKPGAEFMRFAEILFRWRQDFRGTPRKKSRQLVLVESPAEE